MRHFLNDKWSKGELERLNAEPWMVELLKANPSYCSWGPHEDYMWVRGRDEGPDEFGRKPSGGWDARVLCESWSARCPSDLDDLNEVVNFYFELERDSETCGLCAGSGYHPDAQWISESFYEHSSPFTAQTAQQREAALIIAGFGDKLPREPLHGRNNFPPQEVLARYGEGFYEFCTEMARGSGFWSDKLTNDEEAALTAAGRSKCGIVGHDATNRGILIEQRCKRFGVPLHCEACGGHGSVFTESGAHVNLILWVLHPRKGASRGVEIKRIQQAELPEVKAFLAEAARRNAERFSRIAAIGGA